MLRITAEDHPKIAKLIDTILKAEHPVTDWGLLSSEEGYYLLIDVIFQTPNAFDMGYVAADGITHLLNDEEILWHHQRKFPDSELHQAAEPPLPYELRLQLAREVIGKSIEEGNEQQNFNEVELAGTAGDSAEFVVISDECGQAGFVISCVSRVPEGQTGDEVLLEMGYFSDPKQITDTWLAEAWY